MNGLENSERALYTLLEKKEKLELWGRLFEDLVFSIRYNRTNRLESSAIIYD